MPSFQSSDSPSTNLNFLESIERLAQPSRKRQRSLSMQSDSGASSSSVKRSVVDPSSNEISMQRRINDQLSNFAVNDSAIDLNSHEIDAYMAEQGGDDMPVLMATSSGLSHEVLSVPREKKLDLVRTSKMKKMEIGETWYLISRVWYKHWHKACTGEVDKEGPITERDLGPVNNSSLLDSYNNLLPSLAEGVDVEYVPEEIWNLFINWYGAPVHPLPRRVIARGAARLPSLELLPLRLKVFRLVKNFLDPSNTPHPWLTISAGETMNKFCAELASKVSPDGSVHSPYRVWKVDISFNHSAEVEFLGSRLSSSNAKIVEESDKTLEEEGLESDDAFIVEFKQTEGWIADAELPVVKRAVFENPKPLFNSNEGFFNKMSSSSSSASPYKSIMYDGYSGFGPKASSSFSVLSNRSMMKTLEPGILGLGNMGNTCFMNSALQCLAHTKELTDYFLNEVYESELNRDNPLGMGGAIAEAFGALLQRIWASSGVSTSFSPREFKSQLQRFAPQFSGYQQHDSQELVAFLLDGLHEDLNRVIKKPYVEKPDWAGGAELELVQLAQKSWEGYMMRNDSVIVDLFQGQYQSTLVCPECHKVSITFDPFMYLTLPLPVQKKWKHSIFYVPWDLGKPQVKIPVEINRDASFKDLRNLLGRWMDATPENLLTMEIFSHRFYKGLDDSVLVGDLADNDIIVCYELPCNARQGRSFKKQTDDYIIVPVYLCETRSSFYTSSYSSSFSSSFSSNRNQANLFGYPLIIALHRDQAKDVDTMYEFVVNRLQRWTKQATHLFTWEEGEENITHDEINEVPIRINGYQPADSLTEIMEDGNIVTVPTTPPREHDLDHTQMNIDGEVDHDISVENPHKVGVKKDIFNFHLLTNQKDFGMGYSHYSSISRWESWENRLIDADVQPILLREDDAFYCEFEEDKKAYYFGDTHRYEYALWDKEKWSTFTHEEYEESRKAGAEKRHKDITLQDCLEEFTKEEQLGEDDLWYCPQCKKHQQATKKFDLWKVPDILVVHLKRFSNNRTLRDKIDALIDFPIEGLDLSNMVGERGIAKKLLDQGYDIDKLKLGAKDEPLIYDLFAVDEHIGGLGGGHYRAYALNHLNDKWYHFDDSYVNEAHASDSVNANAYLLFYRRRTNQPIGGKSFRKIQEAKLNTKSEDQQEPLVTIDTQLPTPPNETADLKTGDRPIFSSRISSELTLHKNDQWNMRSSGSNAGSSVPSPPTDDPPDFDDYTNESLVSYNADPLRLANQRYDYPDPSNKTSPTSSNEADADIDTDLDQDTDWNDSMDKFTVGVREVFPRVKSDWDTSNQASPSYSQCSDLDLFESKSQKAVEDGAMDLNYLAHEKTD